MTERKNLVYYLALVYPFKIWPAKEGGFVAKIEELPGCVTQGGTLIETYTNLNNARFLWIETAYEDGQEIPEPKETILQELLKENLKLRRLLWSTYPRPGGYGDDRELQ